ncbi:MAG: PH domain-containing protein [Oscillospiraceae bacterium]|nr:PH domain-containing protein [Oscillospiraceae bacterium]
MDLKLSENGFALTKGLVIKRSYVLPISAIVRITVRRTPLMRILRAKEVSVFTLGGKVEFFLAQSEPIPLMPKSRAAAIKPRLRETAFGAFIDTRALGGLFVFAAALRRISALFGGEYFDRVITVLTNTADDIEKALRFFRIAVPRIAVTLGVFALGSWVFAYIRKLLRLSGFRVFVSSAKDQIMIKSGVFTLYEHALVPNSAVIASETLTSFLTRRATLYLRGVMICPCVRRDKLPKTLKTLCGFKMPIERVSSSRRAFFGHIAAPLLWLGVFSAALFAARRIPHSELLKIVLYSGVLIKLYTIILYLLYMGRSGISFGRDFSAVTARRGLRLCTAVFPNDSVTLTSTKQSIFQRRSGLCHETLATIGGSFTARQLPRKECPRHTAF